MKITALIPILEHAAVVRQQVLIVGAPGIGKTQITEQVARRKGLDLITLHPAIAEPTDFRGFPWLVQENGEASARFVAFEQLAAMMAADQPTLVFIDDLGQASEGVQKALMQLIWGRKIAGKAMSDQVFFWGATNDTTHDAGVQRLLAPVKGRFHTILHAEPDLPSWEAWAMGARMPPSLIAFIRARPQLLHQFEATVEIKNSPSPRTVAMMGEIERAGYAETALPELFTGAAGKGVATEYLAFRKLHLEMIDPATALAAPERFPVPDAAQVDKLYMLAVGVGQMAEAGNFEQVIAVAGRLPDEYAALMIHAARRVAPEVENTAAWTRWITGKGGELV